MRTAHLVSLVLVNVHMLDQHGHLRPDKGDVGRPRRVREWSAWIQSLWRGTPRTRALLFSGFEQLGTRFRLRDLADRMLVGGHCGSRKQCTDKDAGLHGYGGVLQNMAAKGMCHQGRKKEEMDQFAVRNWAARIKHQTFGRRRRRRAEQYRTRRQGLNIKPRDYAGLEGTGQPLRGVMQPTSSKDIKSQNSQKLFCECGRACEF